MTKSLYNKRAYLADIAANEAAQTAVAAGRQPTIRPAT